MTTSGHDPAASGENATQLILASNSDIGKDDIIVDSGCQSAQFNNQKWFTKYTEGGDLPRVMNADGRWSYPAGKGTIEFSAMHPEDPMTTIPWTVTEVLYSPASPCNMLSPGAMRGDGIVFDGIRDVMCDKTSLQPLGKLN